MKANKIIATLVGLFALCMGAGAQNTSNEVAYIVPGVANLNVSWDSESAIVPIRTNSDYTVTTSKPWLKATSSADGKRLFVSADTTTSNKPRTATITLKTANGNMTRTINVTQEEERSYETILDKRIKPTTSNASSQQSGETVEKLFDNNTATIWHSAYNKSVSATSPAALTLGFKGTDKIDYMVYTPRQDANYNGTWTSYTITVNDHGKTITTTSTVNADKTPDTIRWEGGIKPNQITISITGGFGGYASGAELGFYQACANKEDLSIFADEIYSQLRPGVTENDINALSNPFCKTLARGLFDGTYDTNYRAASYPCRLSYRVLSEEWNAPGKYYSQLDNPTGINFRTGDEKAVIVSGIPDDIEAELCIMAWYIGKDGSTFDGADPHPTYFTLHNGVNIIKYKYEWDGLGYIRYYANTRNRYEQGVPDIKVHIVNGEINGILTPDKTNEEMYQLCKNAASNGNICIDVLGKKVQAIWTSAGMRDYCKATDGTSLGYRQYINLCDTLIAWEHRQIGLEKYGRIPDNHTMAYTNYQYYMFQGGWGVSFHHNQESRVLNCKTMILNDYDAIWGFSHEWGHQHQMHPYACWGNCSEVTNNIFSYYNVQHLGYVCNMDSKFVTIFFDHKTGSQKKSSKTRADAYKAAKNNSSLFSYCKEMRDLCLAEADSMFTDITTNPSRSYNIYDTSLSICLAPFNKLGNYATIYLNYPDFYPDLFESLRQQNNLPNGSTVEKQGDFDKYELISAVQNGNKNQLYSILANKYPTSCWVTENYLNQGRTSWQDNSTPAVFCFIRKASRLYGYNLYRFFERAGFLTIGAFQHNDYGVKYEIRSQKMLDEFKADMDALETDGTLKPLSEEMLEAIFRCRDFNTNNDKMYPTPDIPN